MKYSIPIGIFVIVTGVVVFILSFYSQIRELQIALLTVAVGLICSGIAQLGQAQEKKQDVQRFEEIMGKLNKIEKELEKVEQPKGTGGVAIADVLASGLKYYTEHMSSPKEEADK